MIETARCIIRPVNSSDAPFILELLTSELWKRFIGDRGITSEDQAKRIIEQNYLPLLERSGCGPHVVALKKTQRAIGTVGIYQRENLDFPDLGFAFLPDYIHQGYGYETSMAHLNYAAKTLKLPKVYAITNDDNVAAQALLRKMKFQRTKAYQPLNEEGKPELGADPMGLYTLSFQES